MKNAFEWSTWCTCIRTEYQISHTFLAWQVDEIKIKGLEMFLVGLKIFLNSLGTIKQEGQIKQSSFIEVF